ncbi:MAG TPA: HNH endonuclease [Ferruginibacter sp.]|jgi:putative restriction endonuclease|nr:HNH endonuclease [Ferruginibacter sp.]
MTTLLIKGIPYTIIDTKEKITIADSFVVPANKLGNGNGAEELFLGSKKDAELIKFLGGLHFNIKCFLLKTDLENYLNDTKVEYLNPEQPYRDKENFPMLWEQRIKKIEGLNDINYFTLEEHDGRKETDTRLYAKKPQGEELKIYKLLRELSLPNITYVSSIKLLAPNKEVVFYFKLFVDYFGETQHPTIVRNEEEKIAIETISDDRKKQINYARIGQGKYRKALLDECPICAITLVSDDRLLIASHIKPWVDSEEIEKTDPKNGFMFTPTYDFLFDRGFISFTNDKKMKVSPWLSKMTCSKLNISDDKKYIMLPVEGREHYLEYHRKNIFKS